MSQLTMTDETYTRFVRDQVLTADQLNGVVEHLARQDRLSRKKLFGIGIVSGLESKRSQGVLSVSPGCAVTSDGHLLWLDVEKVFRSAQGWAQAPPGLLRVLPSGPEPTARPPASSSSVFELLESDDGNKALTNSFLKDKALILYLFAQDLKPSICTGTSCDNKGNVRREQLRFLLVPLHECVTPAGPDVPPIPRKRVFLDTAPLNSEDSLHDAYSKATLELFADIKRGFAELLLPQRLRDAAETATQCTSKLKALAQRNSVPSKNFQYWFDHAQDLAATCNEMRDVIAAMRRPEPTTSFPCHVMLGCAHGGDRPNCRHAFWPSEPIDAQRELLARLRFLLERLRQQLTAFTLPTASTSSVKITPGRFRGVPLGERPIPFYYGYSHIHEHWNLEKARARDSHRIAAYGCKTAEPLMHDLSHATFFRIEGHVGKDVKSALKTITKMIEESNLPIQVVSVAVESTKLPSLVNRPDLIASRNLVRRDVVTSIADLKKILDDAKLHALSERADDLASRASGTVFDFDYAGFTSSMDSFDELFGMEATKITLESPHSLHASYKSFADAMMHLKTIDEQTRKPNAPRATSALERLVSENPGIEHLGGVEWGGTFFLAYTRTGTVVADFSIPWRYAPAQELDEPVKPEPIKPPFKFPLPAMPYLDLERQVRELDLRLLEGEVKLDRLRGIVTPSVYPPHDFGGLIEDAQLKAVADSMATYAKAVEALALEGDETAPERDVLAGRTEKLIEAGLERITQPQGPSTADADAFLSLAAGDVGKIAPESGVADRLVPKVEGAAARLPAGSPLRGRLDTLKTTLRLRRP